MWFKAKLRMDVELNVAEVALSKAGVCFRTLKSLFFGPFYDLRESDGFFDHFLFVNGENLPDVAKKLKPYKDLFTFNSPVESALANADDFMHLLRSLYRLPINYVSFCYIADNTRLQSKTKELEPFGLEKLRCHLDHKGKNRMNIDIPFLCDGIRISFALDANGQIKIPATGKQAEVTLENLSEQLEKDLKLRPYQEEAKKKIFSAWEKTPNLLFQMPTGTGKTRLFVSIIKDLMSLNADNRILIVAHREELIAQISEHLSDHYELAHGIIQGNSKQNLQYNIQVASIQSLFSTKNEITLSQMNFDYIFIDEAHHALAATYRKMWSVYPHSRKLGVTATPWRMGKQSFTTLFGKLIQSPPITDFIQQGYLASYDYYTVTSTSESQKKLNALTKFAADGDYQNKDLDQILNNEAEIAKLWEIYKSYAKGKKGLIYAINQKHGRNILKLFVHHGVNAVFIDSKTPNEERKRWVLDFKENRIDVMINVDIFSEGFDCPDVEFILLARPTRSLAKYLQQVGRGMRPSSGKSFTMILDAVGLYSRFGLPERVRAWNFHFHGKALPDEDYQKMQLHPVGSVNVDELLFLVHSHQSANLTSLEKSSAVTIFTRSGLKGIMVGNKITVAPKYADITLLPCDLYLLKESEMSYSLANREGRLVIENYHVISYAEDKQLFYIQEGFEKGRGYYMDTELNMIPDETIRMNGMVLYKWHDRYGLKSQTPEDYQWRSAKPYGNKWVLLDDRVMSHADISPDVRYILMQGTIRHSKCIMLYDTLLENEDREYNRLQFYPYVIGQSKKEEGKKVLYDMDLNELFAADTIQIATAHFVIGEKKRELVLFNPISAIFNNIETINITWNGRYLLSDNPTDPGVLIENGKELQYVDTVDGTCLVIDTTGDSSLCMDEISSFKVSLDRSSLQVSYVNGEVKSLTIHNLRKNNHGKAKK